VFLRNVGWHSTDYVALYPRSQKSSKSVEQTLWLGEATFKNDMWVGTWRIHDSSSDFWRELVTLSSVVVFFSIMSVVRQVVLNKCLSSLWEEAVK
jgi:hypothetical protein